MPDAARLPAQADGHAPLTLTVDGRPTPARAGESLAASLLAAGVRSLRRGRDGEPRLPFCNMGACFECLVRVDGVAARACLTPARDGMVVASWEEV
jgi:D-hydroxyproline dehydrogenase subunit gamma